MPVDRHVKRRNRSPLSPLVRRELRAQAYGSGLWRIRLLGVAVPLVVGFLIAISSRRSLLDQGQALFLILGAVTTLLLLLVSPILTADCIGKERREGTLGLLFLTPLSAGDIVWGKWLSNTVSLLVLWLATVPILLVPVVVGGISGGLLIMLPLIQLAVICIGSAAGVLSSCLARTFPWTWVTGLAIQAAIIGFIGLLVALISGSGLIDPFATLLSAICIVLVGLFSTAALNHHSAELLKQKWRKWADGDEGSRPLWNPIRSIIWQLPNYPDAPLIHLRAYLDAHPLHPPGEFHFAWLERRRKLLLARKPVDWLFVRHFDPVKAAVSVAIPWLVWVIVYSDSERRPTFPEWMIPPIIALVASRILRTERRTGTIELIAITPTGADQLPWSYLKTLWIGHSWMVWTHIFMSLLVYFTGGRFLGPIAPVGVTGDEARFCWSVFGLIGSWIAIPMVAFWVTLRAAHGYAAGFIAWLLIAKLPALLLFDLPGYWQRLGGGSSEFPSAEGNPWRWTLLLLLQTGLGTWLLLAGLRDYRMRHFVSRRMLS